MPDPLARVRRLCMALPEVTERLSHGTQTWFVRDKKTFVSYHDHSNYDDGHTGIWCAAPDGVQAMLVEQEPHRFYRPAYVGHRGWLGVRLDVDVDWDELAGIIEDAYSVVAPKSLVAQLDDSA